MQSDIYDSLMAVGGETLVVSGSAFGGVYEDVTLSLISTTGEEIILVINETSADTDNLEAVLPSLPSGEYNVSVRVDNVGYAIRCVLKVIYSQSPPQSTKCLV